MSSICNRGRCITSQYSLTGILCHTIAESPFNIGFQQCLNDYINVIHQNDISKSSSICNRKLTTLIITQLYCRQATNVN